MQLNDGHRLPGMLALLLGCVEAAGAQPPPLLPATQVAALADELSGETAKRNLEGLARFHRQRGSSGFHDAAELIAERARSYGLADVAIWQLPADGKIFYGTQRSRPPWDAESGDLTELRDGRELKLASFAAEPIGLAEDSESADVTAELVDVGAGTRESDYAGRDVRGKIVLAAAQAGEVEDLAVALHGALGIVSYAQNQPSAWSGDDDNLVRWGHLQSFAAHKTFGFMVSLRTARGLQERLRRGESIRLHASVKAGQHPGFYEIVTASIPGADPARAAEEIVFSCHLDHQRPGANDNASGCVTILEVARTLQVLILTGKLPRPARTIRFLWPPEIEGTVSLLNARPGLAARIRAVVHMDMVGGAPNTKAVFHVTRGPESLPSFVHDVAWAFASWENAETYRYASTGTADFPLIAPEGGKEPLRAEYSAYTMGSDHDVYQDSSFGIPAIYLNDEPDRYIHTNFDTAANIDPTKLKRAGLIGAASGYFLANFSSQDVAATERAVAIGRLQRTVLALERGGDTPAHGAYEQGVLDSLRQFLADRRGAAAPGGTAASARRGRAARGPRRRDAPRGPLVVFGYDYFREHARAAGLPPPRLLDYQGAWGSGEEYAYETLNFADGTRTAAQIQALLAAEYGPVPLEFVSEYLQQLQTLGLVE